MTPLFIQNHFFTFLLALLFFFLQGDLGRQARYFLLLSKYNTTSITSLRAGCHKRRNRKRSRTWKRKESYVLVQIKNGVAIGIGIGIGRIRSEFPLDHNFLAIPIPLLILLSSLLSLPSLLSLLSLPSLVGTVLSL